MSKRDLFRLVIKLAGLYFLFVGILPTIPTYFSLLVSNGGDLASLLVFVLASLILVGIFVLMVFGTDLVITLFRLDKGFDTEDIELKYYKLSGILHLALILLGGKLIIDNLPNLLSNFIFAFKSMASKNVYPHFDNDSNVKIGVNILFIMIGYLMIAKRMYLVGLLTSRKKVDE
jgi:hypothetical protein